MTKGLRSYFSRRRSICSHCGLPSSYGFHWRGLEENICRVLQPRRYARSAAFSTPPAAEVWIPIRRDVSFGGCLGGGALRMSCSWAIERGTGDYMRIGRLPRQPTAKNTDTVARTVYSPLLKMRAPVLASAVFIRLCARRIQLAPSDREDNLIL